MIGATNAIEKFKSNKLEYIMSTGTQYIDTGIYHDTNTRYEMQIKTLDNTLQYQQIFGARTAYNNADAFNIGFTYGTKMFFNIGGQTNNEFATSEINTVYNIEANATTIKINGVSYSTGASSVSTCPYTDYFLSMNQANTPTDSKFVGMIYYYKIYKGEELVRDYVPYQDENGIYCLYDKVEKKCYYNKGTGEFIGSDQPIITNENIGEYFTVTNSSYYFAGAGTVFTTNNGGKHGSTAQTTLTALYDMDISFNYSYSSENGYDKFYLTFAGSTIANGLSGATTNKSHSGHLNAGQSIVFKYTKDGSANGNNDKCTFSNMLILNEIEK